jgi:phosphinothricin acetyltransferase
MRGEDWEAVSNIYQQAIDAHNVTFQAFVPTYEEWDRTHVKYCRFVAVLKDIVVGFVAINSTSGRECYKGVVDLSIYIDYNHHNKGIGSLLMKELIEQSELMGYWTLQAAIFEVNKASISLHEKFGFRIIGYREKVAKTMEGEWMSTVLAERRSKTIL